LSPNALSQARSMGLTVDSTLPRILVLGLGDLGEKVTERLIESGPNRARCVSISDERLQLGTILAHRALFARTAKESFETSKQFETGGDNMLLSLPEISPSIIDNDLVFIATALGREKGLAASPALAQTARATGALVIGAVTMPRWREGSRLYSAVRTLKEMKDACDALVVVDNNRLGWLPTSSHQGNINSLAGDLLSQLIGGIVETLSEPSLININFKEFARIFRSSGFAILGMGEANSPNRPEEAVRNAFNCPLLHIDHDGFAGAYLHIRGDNSLTKAQASKVAELVSGRLDLLPDVIFGASTDYSFSERLRVTLMLTGVRSPQLLSAYREIPIQMHQMEEEHEPEQQVDIELDLYQLEES